MEKIDQIVNKKKNTLVYVVISVLLAGVIALLVWPEKKVVVNKEILTPKVILEDKYTLVNDINGEIKFPVSEFADEAKFYKYEFNDITAKFFILKSNDGTIRAAFDACDVCFGSKKGYSQVGDFMRCNNCGQTFPEDQINVVLGGCNPSPLERVIVGDKLVIKVDNLELGRRFF